MERKIHRRGRRGDLKRERVELKVVEEATEVLALESCFDGVESGVAVVVRGEWERGREVEAEVVGRGPVGEHVVEGILLRIHGSCHDAAISKLRLGMERDWEE